MKRHPNKTPNELFFGKKPSIAHLRIFGSPVFTHISKPGRTKLDPCLKKCILLSFDDTVKAYRCYRPSTQKIFVSRDVFIDENTLPEPTQTLERHSPPQNNFTPTPTRKEESQFCFTPETQKSCLDTQIPLSPIQTPHAVQPTSEANASSSGASPTHQQPLRRDDSRPHSQEVNPNLNLNSTSTTSTTDHLEDQQIRQATMFGKQLSSKIRPHPLLSPSPSRFCGPC